MALTESNPFPIGSQAVPFKLLDTVSGNQYSLQELKGEKGTLIFFICNHCPFVIHVNSELVALANDLAPTGIKCIAISSNDITTYPQDAPEYMKALAKKENYPFPYLYDENQTVAKAYDAACTPDFYLFDESLSCIYHGQLDDSRPGNGIPVSGKDLRLACKNMLEKKAPIAFQKPSIGCGIKWQ